VNPEKNRIMVGCMAEEDIDGHLWEAFFMEESAIKK
jgi:hypothetical protein